MSPRFVIASIATSLCRRVGFALLATALLMCASVARAQSELDPEQEQVIDPEIERRDIDVPKIDVDDFEASFFFGLFNVEQFGTSPIAELRLAYHVTEDVFIEGALAYSTVSDEKYRRFGLPIFPNEEEQLLRYDISVAYNFLPGEMYLSVDSTMPSSFYVIGGIGSTGFAGEEQFTFNFGVGARVLPTDTFSVRVEMRDYLFESDFLGVNELTNNLELVVGVSLLF